MNKTTYKQLDRLILQSKPESIDGTSVKGWLAIIRKTLGISQEQLGFKLGITKQSLAELEKRESEGTISIKTLENAADALDMKLVYTLVPKDGSLEKLIDRKARELALQIVKRTYTTMSLENQAISETSFNELVEERTAQIKKDLPKALWN